MAKPEAIKDGQRPVTSKQGPNKIEQPSYGARAPESCKYDYLDLLKHNFDRFKEFDSVSILFYFEPHKSEWIPYEEKIQAAIKNAFKTKTSEIEVSNNGNTSLISLHAMYEVDPFAQKRRLIAWIDERRGVCIPKGVKFSGGDDFMKVLKKYTLQENGDFPVCYPLSWDDPELTPHKDMLVKKWGRDITGISTQLFDSDSVSTLERALRFASISEEDSVLGWFSSTGKEIRSVLLYGFNSMHLCLSAYTYPHMWNSLPTDDKGRRTLLLCKFKKGMITDKHFKVRDENGSELTYPAEDHILPVAVFVFKEAGDDDYQERLVSLSKIVDTFGKYLKQTPEIPPEVQDLAIHYQGNKSMFIEELLKLQNDTSVLKFLGSLDSLKSTPCPERTGPTNPESARVVPAESDSYSGGEEHCISDSLRTLCKMDHPSYSSGKVSTSAKRRRRRRGDKEEKLNVRNNQRRICLSLPDELLEEILCRMSVRALTRFKCVSKSWCDRISSEEFINLHLKKYQTSVILVNSVFKSPPYEGCSIFPVYPPSTPREAMSDVDFTVPDYVNNQVPGYVPSTYLNTACNGIICIWASRIPDKIALWNPATKDHKVIPESKLPRQFNFTYSRVMFGYDDVTNDYKIIQVLRGRENTLQLELYSIKSGLWKKLDIGDVIKDPAEQILQYYVSTGGKIVSMIVLHKKEMAVERRWKVVLFDMSTERFEIVQVPIEAAVFNELGVNPFEGSIGLMDESFRDQAWVLNDINSPPSRGGGLRSWRKVNMPKLLEQFKWKLLAVWDDSMLLCDFLMNELFWFDRVRETMRHVGSSQYWIYTGIRYKESLVRLF